MTATSRRPSCVTWCWISGRSWRTRRWTRWSGRRTWTETARSTTRVRTQTWTYCIVSIRTKVQLDTSSSTIFAEGGGWTKVPTFPHTQQIIVGELLSVGTFVWDSLWSISAYRKYMYNSLSRNDESPMRVTFLTNYNVYCPVVEHEKDILWVVRITVVGSLYLTNFPGLISTSLLPQEGEDKFLTWARCEEHL